MDYTRTKTIERESNLNAFVNEETDNKEIQKRLNSLIALNTEYAREENIFHSDQEKFEADMMSNPLTMEKAFSYFGLLIGTIPPATFFAKWFFEARNLSSDESGLFFLFTLVNIVTAIAGYYSGKVVGKIVLELEKLSWHWMLLSMPFIGILWGIISGGAGGIFIFLIGAIFGAIIGGIVGGVALPAFAIFHRIFKRGDKIESKLFYPIAFGITFVISAFILGL